MAVMFWIFTGLAVAFTFSRSSRGLTVAVIFYMLSVACLVALGEVGMA